MKCHYIVGRILEKLFNKLSNLRPFAIVVVFLLCLNSTCLRIISGEQFSHVLVRCDIWYKYLTNVFCAYWDGNTEQKNLSCVPIVAGNMRTKNVLCLFEILYTSTTYTEHERRTFKFMARKKLQNDKIWDMKKFIVNRTFSMFDVFSPTCFCPYVYITHLNYFIRLAG